MSSINRSAVSASIVFQEQSAASEPKDCSLASGNCYGGSFQSPQEDSSSYSVPSKAMDRLLGIYAPSCDDLSNLTGYWSLDELTREPAPTELKTPARFAEALWKIGKLLMQIFRRPELPPEDAEIAAHSVSVWGCQVFQAHSVRRPIMWGPQAQAVLATILLASFRVFEQVLKEEERWQPAVSRELQSVRALVDKNPQLIVLESEALIGCSQHWNRIETGFRGRFVECSNDEFDAWWKGRGPWDHAPRPIQDLIANPSGPSSQDHALEATGLWGATFEPWPQIEQDPFVATESSRALCAPMTINRFTDPTGLEHLYATVQASGYSLATRLACGWSGGDEFIEPLIAMASVADLAGKAAAASLHLRFDPGLLVRVNDFAPIRARWRFRRMEIVEGAGAESMVAEAAGLVRLIWYRAGWQMRRKSDATLNWVSARGVNLKVCKESWGFLERLVDHLRTNSLEELESLASAIETKIRDGLLSKWKRFPAENFVYARVPKMPFCSAARIDPTTSNLDSATLAFLSALEKELQRSTNLSELEESFPEPPPGSGQMIWIFGRPFLILGAPARMTADSSSERPQSVHRAIQITAEGSYLVAFKQSWGEGSYTKHEAMAFQGNLSIALPGLTPPVTFLAWSKEHRSTFGAMPWIGADLLARFDLLLISNEWKSEPYSEKTFLPVVELSLRLLDHLIELESLGIVHGDIKPENIVIDSQGHPMLIDWELTTPPTAICPHAEDVYASPWVAQSVVNVAKMRGVGTLGYATAATLLDGRGATDSRADRNALALSLLAVEPPIHEYLNEIHDEIKTTWTRKRSEKWREQVEEVHRRLLADVRQMTTGIATQYPFAAPWVEMILALLSNKGAQTESLPSIRRRLREAYPMMSC